jgi:hypothetical protein
VPYEIIETCRLPFDFIQGDIISIYPNPNSGEFTIDLSEINSEENTSIHIKNILGEEVYSAQLNSSQHIINLGRSVADGVYLIEIRIGENIITKQITIQH